MFITNKYNNLFSFENSENIGTTDASMCGCIIRHRQNNSTKNYLIIYIPIIESPNTIVSDAAADTIKQIITDASSHECTGLSPDGNIVSKALDINTLIPSGTFYNAKITNIDFIIFSPLYAIYISSTTFNMINSEISGNLTSALLPSSNIFTSKNTKMSKYSPINSFANLEDEIYINCQPTDQEGDLLESGVFKNPALEVNTFDLSNNLNMNNIFEDNMVLSIIMVLY